MDAHQRIKFAPDMGLAVSTSRATPEVVTVSGRGHEKTHFCLWSTAISRTPTFFHEKNRRGAPST